MAMAMAMASKAGSLAGDAVTVVALAALEVALASEDAEALEEAVQLACVPCRVELLQLALPAARRCVELTVRELCSCDLPGLCCGLEEALPRRLRLALTIGAPPGPLARLVQVLSHSNPSGLAGIWRRQSARRRRHLRGVELVFEAWSLQQRLRLLEDGSYVWSEDESDAVTSPRSGRERRTRRAYKGAWWLDGHGALRLLGRGHERSVAARAETGHQRGLQGEWSPGPPKGLAHLAAVPLRSLRAEWTQNFVERMAAPQPLPTTPQHAGHPIMPALGEDRAFLERMLAMPGVADAPSLPPET